MSRTKFFIQIPLALMVGILPAIGHAQSGQDFKVTLTLNEAGDQCVWGGGTEGNGDVVVNAKSGSGKIQIKLEGKDGSMKFGSFNGEGADQMKASGGDKTINIFNANTGPADVKYDVFTTTVIDGKTKTVACEPRIINK